MRCAVPSVIAAVACVVVFACGPGGGPVTRAVVDKTDIGAGEESSPSAKPMETPASSATIEREAPQSTPATSASAGARAGAFVCMMYHVCGCNEGCVGVNVPTAPPTPGTRVTVAVGARAGEEAFVEKLKDKRGKDVLVVGPDDPGAPRACAVAKQGNLMGYACEASKSGAVPIDACAKGCGAP